MSQPIPLNPPTLAQARDLATSPESLAISAMLASGRFTPLEHGLSTDDLSCYEKLWLFCADYQERAGQAPGLEVIRPHFPDYVFIPGVDLNWALDSLKDEAYGRRIRREIHEILLEIGYGDYAVVAEKIRNLAQAPRTHAITGVTTFDPANFDISEQKVGLPTPFSTVQSYTNGMGIDEVWVLGARTGQGKTWMTTAYAAIMAEAGVHSRYLSIEMRASKINKRIAYYHARNDRELLERLKSRDDQVAKRALLELKDRVPGSVEVIDPRTAGAPMNLTTVVDATHDMQMVFIDHIGLLRDSRGVQAITDWRIMAAISNELRDINLRTNCGLFEVTQLNREADKPGMEPPHLPTIGQSTAIEQDADVVILHKQPGDDFLAHGLRKNRDGQGGIFYSNFNPSLSDYREITREQALILLRAHQERTAAH